MELFSIRIQRTFQLVSTPRELLIVPYGIETRKGKHTRVRDYLLIVPYGIETWFKNVSYYTAPFF